MNQHLLLRIRTLSRLARAGDTTAMLNIAEAYRRLAKPEKMLQWFKAAAARQDGQAHLEVGYCYLHGIGTQVDLRRAERHLRAAVSSAHITESGREEAMYNLAVHLIRTHKNMIEAKYLLARANVDGSYAEAQELALQLRRGRVDAACVCRRSQPRYVASWACELHRRRTGQLRASADGASRRR